jgi:hypothetical protein
MLGFNCKKALVLLTKSILMQMTREYQPIPLTWNKLSCDPGAWDIVYTFATDNEMVLPEAENKLHEHLGIHFIYNDWLPALKAIMDAEGDTLMALNMLDDMQKRIIQSNTHLIIKIPAQKGVGQMV